MSDEAEPIVLIPARFAASRLPGKPLRRLGDRPLIAHVVARALALPKARVVVATDHPDIAAAARAAGAEACMTPSALPSGSDRLAWAVRELQIEPGRLIINLQGDEPLMPVACLQAVAERLRRGDVEIATLAVPLHDPAELLDPACVKLVLGAAGRALYFSRAPIPWDREAWAGAGPARATAVDALRHIGLYAWRAETLCRFAALPPGRLERIELLEQLRALEVGWNIGVAMAPEPVPAGVDTFADLERVAALLGG